MLAAGQLLSAHKSAAVFFFFFC